MWNTQDAWETNKYNQGASAYKDYFNAIADKSFDTEESGFTSGIYTPRGGSGSSNPYANSTFGTYGDQGQQKIQGAPPISGAGGTGYTGGGAPLGEWGTQAYNPQNPYMGMGDVSAPGYGQQNGPGWLNQQSQSNDDLPSYLQDIASQQNPYAGSGDWQ
jgi:hypothetical protein